MSSSIVKSADRALAVLQTMATQGRPLSTQELASACEIPKSSAHHLLNVMKDRGFVAYRERERTWALGSSIVEVAAAYRRSDPLQIEGGPALARLTGELGHTAHLAVLRDTEVLYIDKRDAREGAVRLVTEVGSRLPASATAVGQAILGFLPRADVLELYRDTPFLTGPREVAASEEEMLDQLADVARKGFAHDVGMISSGISCAASPVFDAQHMPVASIGVTFVTAQADREELHQITATVRLAAAQLSALIGGTTALPEVLA